METMPGYAGLTENDIHHILETIIRAGQEVMKIYTGGFSVETKADNTPVTAADRMSQKIIREALQEIRDSEGRPYPFLGEEDMDIDYDTRSGWETYWLVDPLDGTKEFVNKRDEFTINIALISRRIPAAGFVYIPATDFLYWGLGGRGAYRAQEVSVRSIPGIISGAEALPVLAPGEAELLVVGSKSHMNRETLDYIDGLRKKTGREVRLIQAGSSLKLCRLAEGSAELYPRFGPTMEWDVAAALSVCRGAGCAVIDLTTGEEMEYNKKTLLNSSFIAATRSHIGRYLPPTDGAV